MKPDEFLKLKRKVAELQEQAAKASGVLEQAKRQLLDEFGCNNVKEAKALLERLKSEIRDDESKLSKSFDQFKEEWGKVLLEGLEGMDSE